MKEGRVRRKQTLRPMLMAESLTLFYGNRKVLDGVSLVVGQGEIVTILGPNGGGKTSLVRILVGINRNYEGTVSYVGKHTIAYMPQNFRVNTLIPVTVEYLLMNACWSRSMSYNLLRDSEKYVDITRLLHRQVAELSAGEVQTVLLVRCIMMKPDLIVLDEPVSCMDIDARNNFYQLIGRLVAERNISVVMTSHDLHCVMACSDRVICINRTVHCEGTPSEIAENARFMSVFPDNV